MNGPSAVQMGKEVIFECDASRAGWGKVQLEVQIDGHNVPVSTDERGDGIYVVSFLPSREGHYKIFATFNNVDVHGKLPETQCIGIPNFLVASSAVQ